jgi:hypothetical protein
MRTILPAALLWGVSAPALAGDFYNDTCASQQGSDVWTLALSVTGDHAVQFFRETGRVRIGKYEQPDNGDDVYATIEDLRIHLRVRSGAAAWQSGAAKGTRA